MGRRPLPSELGPRLENPHRQLPLLSRIVGQVVSTRAPLHLSRRGGVRGGGEGKGAHNTRLPSDCTMRKTLLSVEFSLTPCRIYGRL